MRVFVFWCLIAATSFLGAGCTYGSRQIAQIPSASTTSSRSVPAWKGIEEGVERYESPFGDENARGRLILYRISLKAFDWQFEISTSSRTVAEWVKDERGAFLAINGVYFHEDQLPSGFFVSRGTRYGARAFDLDKSGMIDLSPTFRLIDTTHEPAALSSLKEAAQSYPFLIKQGNGALTRDTGHVAYRSFIGTDQQDRAYIGVAVGEALSLYRLMDVLQKQPVEWKDVLNLDGGPSTGLVSRFTDTEEILNSFFPVSNILILRKRSASAP